MKIRLTLAALALAAAPTLALAGGPGCSHLDPVKASAATCADGAVWDAAKGACVKITS